MTTQERIKADAEKAFPMRDTFHNIQRLGYIAGATAIHDRAQVLVDALAELVELKRMSDETPLLQDYLKRKPLAWEAAREALEQWKSGKI